MSKYFYNFLKITFFISLAVYLFDQGAGWIDGDPIGTFAEELKHFANYFLFGFLIGGVNIYLVNQLDKRFPWNTQADKRLIIGLIGAIIVSLLAIAAANFILTILYGHNVQYFLDNQKAIHYFYSLLITLVIVLIFHAFYFYKALSEKKVTNSEIVAKTEQAKYESLKSQLDPHFLFNSLNVLTSLISENPAQAEKFATKLSKIYRYVLEQKDKDLIPLQEELDFAKSYMELLKMRFEDAVDFSLPEQLFNPDFKIVPLSLQILLENAVKHNVISKEKPLKIAIFIKNESLCVENKCQFKQVLNKSTQLGLKNIFERYALISKRRVEVVKTNELFSVCIPLLTKKIKIMDTNFLLEERYLSAKRRVKAMKDFYIGLISYSLIIPFLFYMWHTYTPDALQWFWFPAIGMGAGLAIQAAQAFNYTPFLGRNWEERKLRDLMNDDKKQFWE